jgi:hypothetical protein
MRIILILLLLTSCSRRDAEIKQVSFGETTFSDRQYSIFCNVDPNEIYIKEFEKLEGNMVICKYTETPDGFRFRKQTGDALTIINKHQSYIEHAVKNSETESLTDSN